MVETVPEPTNAIGANPIAVSLLTGFLGSGKTTLLNHLLAHPEMDRTAVLINEFGEVGLDHLMVREIDKDVVLLKSGCICCTVQGELVDGLKELYMKRLAGRLPPFSRVIVETTGLADPLPIITCLMRDPLFKHAYVLDTLVTTVDAVYGSRQLDEHPEALRQAAVADRILLTKSDLADAGTMTRLRERLHGLNPGAQLIPAEFGRVPPRALFGTGVFDPTGKSPDVQRWLNQESYGVSEHDRDHAHGASADHAHARIDVNRHDDHIASFCIVIDEPIAWDVFKAWYEELAEKEGDALLRVKGIVNIQGASSPFLVHCVQSTQHAPTPLASWPDADRRSRIVFITRDLPRATVEKNLRERLAQAPPKAVSPPPAPGPRPASSGRWLNPAELSRLFAALTAVRDRDAADVLRLMLLTGIGADDVRAARWEDFDLNAKAWMKRTAASVPGPVKPRPRRIPLGDAAWTLLMALAAGKSGTGQLFPALVSAPGKARVQQAWNAAQRHAGIEEFQLSELPPALAADLFAGLAPDLTRALLGLGTERRREVA